MRKKIKVKIKLMEGGKLPEFKTRGAVCCDCYARLNVLHRIAPHKRAKIPLGFAMELPLGWEAVVRPRSGLTSDGQDIGIGSIDYDFRGEVSATVINDTNNYFTVENGDRICQLAIREAPKVNFVVVDELTKTERGSNGFGSTGIR